MLHFHTVDDGQSNKHRLKYRGVIHATVSIAREEGLRGLYRVSLLHTCHTVWSFGVYANLNREIFTL